jgi:hypothetical protein
MDGFAVFLVIVVLGFVVWNLIRSRKKQAQRMEDAASTAMGSDLATVRGLFDADAKHLAPVSDFHVHDVEARVTFDVPLPDVLDEVLNELLIDQAIEVVREKNRDLPIDMVEVIVVFAGKDEVREVGRHDLPSVGILPPPSPTAALSFAHIAHDPFAAPFESDVDHSIHYDTKSDVSSDELGPMIDELKIPDGLDRGLRANGVDPDGLDGPQLVLALLRLFGYGVSEQAYPGSYMAIKDGLSTYILTESHVSGQHPELEEDVIRRFLADFNSSGAERGILVTDKYSPFMIHEIESNQPKVRFITRERVQVFVDSMALG